MEARRQASSASMRRGRFTRRAALRGGLGLAAIAVLSGVATPLAAQQSTPDSTIEQFYLGVATYQYDDAYALLGSELQAKQSLDAFIKGYADTAYVQVAITGHAASAGQQDVGVTITSWHNDGSIHAYSGTYTLNQVSGGWKIAAASITESARPQNVAPLMRFADLDVTLGQPDAGMGHRYYHLLVTNNAQWAVTAAGVPHLKLLNASGGVVMDSSPGQLQPITAVALQPGQTADAQFEWSNWCESAPTYPLKLQIAIPGDTHELLIPFTTPMGQVQAPPCMGNASPAVFQSQAFQAAEQQ
jgi:hypothetical protein